MEHIFYYFARKPNGTKHVFNIMIKMSRHHKNVTHHVIMRDDDAFSYQAPDALGEVPLKDIEVYTPRHVPFHELVVPKYYQIAGYEKHDVAQALKSYVPPNLARPLRSGAEVRDDVFIFRSLEYFRGVA